MELQAFHTTLANFFLTSVGVAQQIVHSLEIDRLLMGMAEMWWVGEPPLYCNNLLLYEYCKLCAAVAFYV